MIYTPEDEGTAFVVGMGCSLNLPHDFHQIPSYDMREREREKKREREKGGGEKEGRSCDQ